MAMPEQDNKALVRQGYEALNERDPDAFRAAHADDIVIHDHDEEVHGIDAVVDHQ